MPYRSREHVRVWEYYVLSNGEVEWKQKDTTAILGTKDEYYFWRVINCTGRHFFASPEQWMDYSGHDGTGLEEIVLHWHNRYNDLVAREELEAN